jgi:hypothetical protein
MNEIELTKLFVEYKETANKLHTLDQVLQYLRNSGVH